MAHVILNVAQMDLMTDVLGDAFTRLGMFHFPDAFVVKRRTCRISSGFAHNSW